jgi:hypothetical protein
MRRLMTILAVAGLSFAASQLVLAETNASGEEVICKRQPVTGTRVRKVKVCRSKAEWAAESRQIKEALRSNERNTSTGPGGQVLPRD